MVWLFSKKKKFTKTHSQNLSLHHFSDYNKLIAYARHEKCPPQYHRGFSHRSHHLHWFVDVERICRHHYDSFFLCHCPFHFGYFPYFRTDWKVESAALVFYLYAYFNLHTINYWCFFLGFKQWQFYVDERLIFNVYKLKIEWF